MNTTIKVDTLDVSATPISPATPAPLSRLGTQVNNLVNDNTRLRTANTELLNLVNKLRAER